MRRISFMMLMAIAITYCFNSCAKKEEPAPALKKKTSSIKVFQTTDGGASWTEYSTIEQSGSPIEISYTPPFTYFISTKDTNFYVSNSGGNSWARRPIPGKPSNLSISTGRIPGFCAAVSPLGKVYLTYDLGAHWTIPKFSSKKTLCTIHISGGYGLGFICGEQGTVLMSDDTGENWTELPQAGSGDLFDIDYSDGGITLIAGGQQGKVYVSSDSGNSWTPKSVDPLFVSTDNITRVNIDDNGMDVVCIGGNSVYHSSNKGQNWQKAVMSPGNNNLLYDIGGTSNALFIVGANGAYYKSTDLGASWQSIDLHYQSYTFKGIDFKTDNEGLMIAEN